MTARLEVGPRENESTDATQETNNDVDVESEACTRTRIHRKRKRGENSGGCTCKKSKVS